MMDKRDHYIFYSNCLRNYLKAAVPLPRQYLEERREYKENKIQEWINMFIESGDDDYIIVYPRTVDKVGCF